MGVVRVDVVVDMWDKKVDTDVAQDKRGDVLLFRAKEEF